MKPEELRKEIDIELELLESTLKEIAACPL